jgi:hypothetical protein
MVEPAWRSELRTIVAVSLGETSAVCILESYAERETAISPAKDFFNVRWLQPYPATMSYPQIVEDVRLILQRIKSECDLIVNETLVGSEVSKLFKPITKAVRVNISNTGSTVAQTNTAEYSVPLSLLKSIVKARFHSEEIRVASELAGAVDLEAALKNFTDCVSVADIHDRRACALAVGLWRAISKKSNFRGSRSKPEVLLGYAHLKKGRGYGGPR